MNRDNLTTGIFRMPGSRFARHLLSEHAGKWFLALAILAVPALAAGIFADLRYIIIFLMIVLIIMPMMLSFLYIVHGMRPLSASNIALHDVSFLTDRMRINIFVASLRVADKGDDSDADSHPEMTKHSEKEICYSDIKDYSVGLSSVTLRVDGQSKGFLWIPTAAFAEEGDIAKALDMIFHNNSQPQYENSQR